MLYVELEFQARVNIGISEVEFQARGRNPLNKEVFQEKESLKVSDTINWRMLVNVMVLLTKEVIIWTPISFIYFTQRK